MTSVSHHTSRTMEHVSLCIPVEIANTRINSELVKMSLLTVLFGTPAMETASNVITDKTLSTTNVVPMLTKESSTESVEFPHLTWLLPEVRDPATKTMEEVRDLTLRTMEEEPQEHQEPLGQDLTTSAVIPISMQVV